MVGWTPHPRRCRLMPHMQARHARRSRFRFSESVEPGLRAGTKEMSGRGLDLMHGCFLASGPLRPSLPSRKPPKPNIGMHAAVAFTFPNLQDQDYTLVSPRCLGEVSVAYARSCWLPALLFLLLALQEDFRSAKDSTLPCPAQSYLLFRVYRPRATRS